MPSDHSQPMTREKSRSNDTVVVEMNNISSDSHRKEKGSASVENDFLPDYVVDAAEGPPSSGIRSRLQYIFFEKEPLLCQVAKWVFIGLLALFLASIVFGIFYSGFRTTSSDTSRCDTVFGTMLGSHNGVIGFSNCNSDYVSADMYTMPMPVTAANGSVVSQSAFVGMKWQCVEYARRYWMLAGTPEPAFFGDIDGAADIWDLKTVTIVRDMKTTRPLYAFPNGASVLAGGALPKVGDIIIYPRQLGDEFPAGHVAVIVKVDLPLGTAKDAGKVYVAEQNWDSGLWVAPFYNYSRTIPLTYDSKTLAYTISDPYGAIDGWMRYG